MDMEHLKTYFFDVGYLSNPKRQENIEQIINDFRKYGLSNFDVNNSRLHNVAITVYFSSEQELNEFKLSFKQSELYKKSKNYLDGYESDIDDLRKALAGDKRWTVNDLQTILKTEGGWWNSSHPAYWYTLTALINLGGIKVKEVYYENIPIPIIDEYPYYGEGKGGEDFHQKKWHAFYLLRELSGETPERSYSTHFYSSKLKMHSKAGDLDPSVLINLLDESETHIHFPIHVQNYYYHFYTSEEFEEIRKNNKRAEEEIDRLIREEQAKEEEKKKENEWRWIEELKLENYFDDSNFDTKKIAEIIKYNTSLSISSDEIRHLIKNGTLKGEKKGNRWFVKKHELQKYISQLKR